MDISRNNILLGPTFTRLSCTRSTPGQKDTLLTVLYKLFQELSHLTANVVSWSIIHTQCHGEHSKTWHKEKNQCQDVRWVVLIAMLAEMAMPQHLQKCPQYSTSRFLGSLINHFVIFNFYCIVMWPHCSNKSHAGVLIFLGWNPYCGDVI